jgi:hypothetical protein
METVVLFQWKLKKELLDEKEELTKCPVCLAETKLGSDDEIMDGLFVYHCWNCSTHIIHED